MAEETPQLNEQLQAMDSGLFLQMLEAYVTDLREPETAMTALHTGKVLLVEYACQPDSELSKEAEKNGWEYLRLTRETHDVRLKTTVSSTIDTIRKFHQKGFLVVLWGSIPCTPWTRWQDMNVHRHGKPFEVKLQKQRAENLLMVRNFREVALVVHQIQGIIAYEWPAHCKGWENPTVSGMIQDLQLQEARFDGCQLGLVSKDGVPILKPWKVFSNSPRLTQELCRYRCRREHKHQEAEGQHTERTGFYPAKMCRIIIKALKEELLGQVSSDARDPGHHA